MIIKKIELKGYKRLFLNNIDTLTYTPDKPMQIILGRNMSGKSSLLRLLNPLPANLKQDFNLTGYKKIEIEHNGKYYKLSSINKKHSFIVDEKELNTSGTISIQYKLVLEHFNLTPEILEILLNNIKLTEMSIADRRKWISNLSTVDYQYAITCYNKLKSLHRDITGGIKLLQDEIIKSESHMVNKDILSKLRQDKLHLESFHNHIISLYDHNVKDNVNINIEPTMNKLSNLLSLNITGSISELETEVIKSKTLLETYNTQLEQTLKQIEELEKISKIDDIEKLKNEVINKQKYIEELEILNTFKIEYNKIEDYYNKFLLISPDIISILNTLEEYNDVRNLTSEEITELLNKQIKLDDYVKLCNKRIDLCNREIEHINKHKTNEYKVECPKCNYNWYNGYDSKKVEELNKVIIEYKNKFDKANKLLLEVNNKIDRINKKNDILDRFKTILKLHTDLKVIWDIILDKIDIDKSTIQEILTVWNNVNLYLFKIKDLTLLYQEVKDIQKIIDTYEEINKKYNNNKLEDLIKLHDDINSKKHNLILHIRNDVLNKLDILKKIKSTEQELKSMLFTISKNKKNNIIKERNKYLLEYSNYVKEQIMEIDNIINNNTNILSKLNKDKELLKSYKDRVSVLDKMLLALSPSEGLIAKSINSFLSIFVQEMNDVISKIWTYDLEILPCDITDTTDLDYKFKVRINNTEIIEDISKLSSSGKEIVNLAWRLVFMKYMHIQNIPLYLDEFGSTMDKTHTQAAYNVIDKIMTSEYPQVFFISHNESQYGSLHLCDFNVLDKNNIGLETIKEYNKNFILN